MRIAAGFCAIAIFAMCGTAIALQGAGIKCTETGAEPAPTPQRIRVSSGVGQRLLIKKVNPKYPSEARREGVQGAVILQAHISRKGDITDLQVISGDPLLSKEALKAVYKWKYNPFVLDGKPVEVETQIQVNFVLTKN